VARRRRRDGPSGSLFPFLSVLACVIGTLTLSLAALALGQMGDEKLRQRLAGLGFSQDISLEDLKAAAELRRELEELARRQRETEREGERLTAVIETRERETEQRGLPS